MTKSADKAEMIDILNSCYSTMRLFNIKSRLKHNTSLNTIQKAQLPQRNAWQSWSANFHKTDITHRRRTIILSAY